jgi:bacterioferritin-associated ferredoxin
MTAQNNPLKQYFRRPAVYITLPSKGKFYPDGVIKPRETEELPVYPMTAIDEITVRTPDALFNGDAMIQLIQSCVPDILQPWAINSIDLDALLIAIRSASGENKMDVDSTCPECGEANNYAVELHKILPQLTCPDFDEKLSINGLKVKFKPLTYKEINQAAMEQFNVQRLFANLENIQDEATKLEQTKVAVKAITETTMKIVTTSVEYIDTGTEKVTSKEYILDFLVNCDKNVYAEIRDYMTKMREASQVKPLHLTCPNCNHEYNQLLTLDLSNFFG